jgi:hypothetical protein
MKYQNNKYSQWYFQIIENAKLKHTSDTLKIIISF